MRITDYLPTDWEHQPVSLELPSCFRPTFAEQWKSAVDATGPISATNKDHWLNAISVFLDSCYGQLKTDPFVDPAETVNDRIYQQLLNTYRSAKNWLSNATVKDCIVADQIVLTLQQQKSLEANEYDDLTKTWDQVSEFRTFNGSGYSIKSYLDHAVDNAITNVYNFDISIVISDWPVLDHDYIMSNANVRDFILELYNIVKSVSP